MQVKLELEEGKFQRRERIWGMLRTQIYPDASRGKEHSTKKHTAHQRQ